MDDLAYIHLNAHGNRSGVLSLRSELPAIYRRRRYGTPLATFIAMLFPSRPPVEARTWLRARLDAPVFATHRFRETHNALEFVEALYAQGATEVLVDDPHLTSNGRLLADTLLVRFPPDGVTKFRLVQFCEREGADPNVPEDFVLTEFAAELRLWW